ncbi:uncharacterized protein LOC110425865 [Herrania umbratica]|uniref:Uncharacterized protein LOC110425865 n=1 Tax=Herrania umbratica TaxID=108875 RepID=A0A6J1BAW3_9ROSI|nr:uncharacterized protein LOC110425865 [Herrania umbratica]
MGRKLDALLGRNFKASKFKTLAKLAVSRIAILKNQHQVRFSHARSDVIDLLNLGHQERALLRVEHVIKEQNLVDALTIMESYFYLLIERVMLIQKNKECPDELKEATSSLMFASSRCGEFPELLHIRGVVSSTFGKEFVARAVELRNNCSVHPKIVQKLSTRQPSLESKLKVLKEIASERGIALHLEVDSPVVVEEEMDVNEKQNESTANKSANLDDPEHKYTAIELPREMNLDEKLSESIKARKKYRDVAAAAQEAFESAAYAAAAARAAVELSRTESQDFDPDDESGSTHKKGGPSLKKGAFYDSDASAAPEFQGNASSDGIEHSNNELGFEKIHPIDNYSSESEGEDVTKNNNGLELNEIEEIEQRVWIERALSTSSSDSDVDISTEKKLSSDQLRQNEHLGNELAIDLVNNDREKEKDETQRPKSHDLSSTNNLSSSTNEDQNIRQNEEFNKDESKFPYQSPNLTNTQSLNFVEQLHSKHSHIDRKWVSMRTRRERRI